MKLCLLFALAACAPITPAECMADHSDVVIVGYYDGREDQAECSWVPAPPQDIFEAHCYALGYEEGWGVSAAAGTPCR